MCGICGIVDLAGPGRDHTALVDRMNGLMVHRGPDEGGVYRGGSSTIGMRRLSIIDLPGGHQPISNEDGTVWVVLNGEIYNFIELRADLEAAGHVFSTRSDTEVLVHLYEEHGDGFLPLLNGMFAFALLDTRRDRLLLARDRVGKKPLYIAIQDGLLGFSSDIKPLFLLPGMRREVDLDALNALLRHNYVPRPHTIFAGISEVPAGGVVVVEGGRVKETRYWRLEDRIRIAPEPATAEQARETVRALFADSIRLRMRSDVPVGLFLSGGIDSSLVATHMRAAAPEGRLLSFSVGFAEPEFDESAHAAAVAGQVGTEHRTTRLVPDGVLERYQDLMWYLEEPHGDTSFLPTYELAGLAGQHVRVVLTGDGGDEVFAGYSRYLAAAEEARRTDPATALRHAVDSYVVADDPTRRRLLEPDAWRPVAPAPSVPALETPTTPGGVVRALLARDVLGLLTDNNVVKPDRMGMACSIETRCPFLDYRLVEYALNLPGETHLGGGRTKSILRDLAAEVLPARLVQRPKQQFTVPFGEWLKEDRGGEMRRLLESLGRRPWFRRAEILAMLDEHQAGKANHGRLLRLLIVFEMWSRAFLDRDPTATGPPRPRPPPPTMLGVGP